MAGRNLANQLTLTTKGSWVSVSTFFDRTPQKTDIILYLFYNGFQTSFQRVPHVSQSTHRKPR